MLPDLTCSEIARRFRAAGLERSVSVALVVDGDRTLTPDDTGRLVGKRFGVNGLIREVFERSGYTVDGFAQVAELWGQVPAHEYLVEVSRVSQQVALAPGWYPILEATRGHCPVIVVSAGMPQIWKRLLQREGFGHALVFGGCHAEVDRHIVSPEAKQRVVEVVRSFARHVVCVGDSTADALMLRAADLPLFVPDDRQSEKLRAALSDVSHLKQLLVGHRSIVGVPACAPRALAQLLLSSPGGMRHAA